MMFGKSIVDQILDKILLKWARLSSREFLFYVLRSSFGVCECFASRAKKKYFHHHS